MQLALDTSHLNAAITSLARLTGANYEQIVESEVAAILQAAIRGTKASKAAAIRTNYDKKPATMLARNKNLYFLDNRYPDRLWAEISAQRKAGLQERLARRGISKKSWLLLARAMGVTISAPGFVTNAAVRGRSFPENVAARRAAPGVQFFREGTNDSPTVRFAGGASALQRAINGRARYFEQNLQRGVFRDVANIARRYPGIRVS